MLRSQFKLLPIYIKTITLFHKINKINILNKTIYTLQNMYRTNNKQKSTNDLNKVDTYLCTYLFSYFLAPWSRVLLARLTSSQLVKKLPTFYRTWKSITASTSNHQLSYPEPDQSSSYPYFLKIHLNIILPTMHGSSKWSLFLRFPHQNPVYTCPLPYTCYVTRPSHSRFITREK